MCKPYHGLNTKNKTCPNTSTLNPSHSTTSRVLSRVISGLCGCAHRKQTQAKIGHSLMCQHSMLAIISVRVRVTLIYGCSRSVALPDPPLLGDKGIIGASNTRKCNSRAEDKPNLFASCRSDIEPLMRHIGFMVSKQNYT